MDTMERYNIQGSIEDVIDILYSAPMHRDLIPETMIVQCYSLPYCFSRLRNNDFCGIRDNHTVVEVVVSMRGRCKPQATLAFVDLKERVP